MFEHWENVDINELPNVKELKGVVFTQDSGANRIGYVVTSHEIPVSLAGDVRANIILPNGTTITQTGEKSGNRAWVDLPDEAYNAYGKIGVFIAIINGSDRTTLGGIEAVVQQSMTDQSIQ